MAQLPETLDIGDPEAQRPSLQTVNPTDFGLGQTAQELGRVEMMQHRAQALQLRAQAAQDRKAAMPTFLKFQNEAEDSYGQDAGAWNGQTAGFASDQITKTQAIGRKYAAVPGLSPGQQSELNGLVSGYTNELGARAIAHERQTLQDQVAQTRVNNENIQVDQAFNAANKTYQPAALSLKQGWKVGDPDLDASTGALFDQHFAPALQSLPKNLQPQAQARLIGAKQNAIADALAFQVNTQNAHMLRGVNDQADTIVNTITSNPAYYDQAVGSDLPSVIAKMPGNLQEQATRDFTQRAVVARVAGLIGHGQAAQAYQELQGPTYDKVLEPNVRQQLQERATSAMQSDGPKTADQIVAAHDLQQKVEAEAAARLRGETTGLNLSGADALLGQHGIANAQIVWSLADRTHAAIGAYPDMTDTQLQAAAHAPDPDPSDPDYAAKIQLSPIARKAAADELAQRQADPAASLFQAQKTGAPSKGVGAMPAAQQRAVQLNQQWQQVMSSGGATQAQAATGLATASLGYQAQRGTQASDFKLLPQVYVGQLAADLRNAPDDQKLAAFQRAAGVLHAFPQNVRLPDGSYAAPQQIMAQQLKAAGLNANDVSALVDYGADPAKLGRYIQAVQNPKVTAKPDAQEQAQIKQLTAQVTTALKPFFDVTSPLPGQTDLYQARVARSVMIARSEMANGAGMRDAVNAAVGDLTSGYRYVDTWRMPEQIAGAVSFNPHAPGAASIAGFQDGVGITRQGSAAALSALLANGGANLFGQGGQKQMQALQIQHNARWVSSPDDSGLVLMVPHPGAPWEQVRDKWGRPVAATWQQLQGFATGAADPAQTFAKPPPQAIGPGGQPVAAFTRQQAFGALSQAIVGDGEKSGTGAISPKGAAGKWQVMPATVQTYAPRLGLPVDLDRAANDDGYNARIGGAALADNLNYYKASQPGGVALAVAAYNAGQGNVNKWLASIGDPRTGKISVDDWVAKIPFKETREYVQRVLPGAVRRLQAQGG